MKRAAFHSRPLFALCLSAGWLFASCGADQGGGGSQSGNRGGSLPGGGFFDDDDDSGGGGNRGFITPGEEGECGIVEISLNNEPPEVMLVLDRSGSMQRTTEGDQGTPSKWAQTADALASVLDRTSDDVGWGLQMYPTCQAEGGGLACEPTPCTVSGLDMSPDFGQASSVLEIVNGNAPVLDTGATPTASAVDAARALLEARDTDNPKFILLATDGTPNCRDFPGGTTGGGSEDPEGAISAIERSYQAGISVFVVGIATVGSNSHNTLNDMAEAGGESLSGETKYFPVSNQAQLEETLTGIAGQVQDCTFQLRNRPPQPHSVAVDIGGQRLGDNDWVFGPGNRSIVVRGDWCEDIKKGDLDKEKARISFTCAGMEIPL